MSERLEQDQPDLTSTPPTVESSETESQSATSLYPTVTPAADASLTELEEAPTVAAIPTATKPHHRPVKSFWREVLETVLLTIMIFFLVKGVMANFRIQGSSMEPNFHTNQLVLVNKAAYFHVDMNTWARLIPGVQPQNENYTWLFGGPHRGDVIIFEPPDAQDEDYIKRVIGLPGDKVEVKGGKVYVNEVALDEPYIREAPFSPYNPAVVPPNHLFVMGDNRNASRDSRSFGMLPVDLIVGKAMVVYWPTGDKWGLIPEIKY